MLLPGSVVWRTAGECPNQMPFELCNKDLTPGVAAVGLTHFRTNPEVWSFFHNMWKTLHIWVCDPIIDQKTSKGYAKPQLPNCLTQLTRPGNLYARSKGSPVHASALLRVLRPFRITDPPKDAPLFSPQAG